MVSRSLTAYEKKRTLLEQKLFIAGWALYRCRRFTTTAPSILLHVPEPEAIMVLSNRTHHLRLEALLVDLRCYQVKFDMVDQT
jgi:hypothetical protein